MLNVALIDSGVYGTTQYFAETPEVRYRIERIRDRWQPDFSADDLVVVPNGANHVALYEARGAIRTFLDGGGTLACFCGFFTPWIPGNQWVHDNRQPLRPCAIVHGGIHSVCSRASTSTSLLSRRTVSAAGGLAARSSPIIPTAYCSKTTSTVWSWWPTRPPHTA